MGIKYFMRFPADFRLCALFAEDKGKGIAVGNGIDPDMEVPRPALAEKGQELVQRIFVALHQRLESRTPPAEIDKPM